MGPSVINLIFADTYNSHTMMMNGLRQQLEYLKECVNSLCFLIPESQEAGAFSKYRKETRTSQQHHKYTKSSPAHIYSAFTIQSKWFTIHLTYMWEETFINMTDNLQAPQRNLWKLSSGPSGSEIIKY